MRLLRNGKGFLIFGKDAPQTLPRGVYGGNENKRHLPMKKETPKEILDEYKRTQQAQIEDKLRRPREKRKEQNRWGWIRTKHLAKLMKQGKYPVMGKILKKQAARKKRR